jgi:hypothetical protein
MKIMIKTSIAALAILNATPAQAGCPTLSSAELGKFLCPIAGAMNPFAKNTVVYQRPVDIKGAFSNLCSAISKSTRSDAKTYPGAESNRVDGKLVCHYTLPRAWKGEAGIDEFAMSSTITTPISERSAVCPSLRYDELKSAMCGTTFEIGGAHWTVLTKGVEDEMCKVVRGGLAFLKGIINDGPKDEIHGQIGEGTHAFEHVCKYSYHKGSTPATLTLNGKMDLNLLREANAHLLEHAEAHK